MEILETFTTEIKARRARETIAAAKGARFDPVSDTYVYFKDGKEQRLAVQKVGDKYLYRVVLLE